MLYSSFKVGAAVLLAGLETRAYATTLSLTAITMNNLPPHTTVNCKTIDGITLEGWLYTVEGRAPAIIMTHGVRIYKSCLGVLGLTDS